MTSVSRWLREVEASDLPSTLKLFLLIHATSRGKGAFHDAAANVHSYKYQHIADRTSHHVRTVNRLMNRAMDEGYLHRHSGGWRGHLAEFHYTLPWEPTDCPDCVDRDEREAQDEPARSVLKRVTTTAPNPTDEKDDIVVTPSSTEGDVVKHLPIRGLQTAAWRPRGSDEGEGNPGDQGAAVVVAPNCRVCGSPLHPGLWQVEPGHPTHPSCELRPNETAA